MRPPRWPVVVFVIGVALALPTGALAAPAWVGVTTVGSNVEGRPRVTMAPDGAVTVVWVQQLPTRKAVHAATRPPGGAFSSPVPISVMPLDVESLDVVSSRSGHVVATWREQEAGHSWRAAAAVKPPGQGWVAAVPLSDDGVDATSVDAAISAAGQAVAVWERGDRMQAALRPPSAGWTQPEDLSDFGNQVSAARVASTRDGTVTALWLQTGSTSDRVMTASRSPGGTWSTGAPLSAEGARVPALAAGSAGHLAAIWLRHPQAEGSIRTPGGAWTSPAQLGTHSVFEDQPAVAIDGQGTATALWTDTGGGGPSGAMRSARGTVGGWTPEMSLLRTGFSDSWPAAIAASPAGHFIASWPGQKGAPPTDIQAATRVPGGAWSAVQGFATIQTTLPRPDVSMDDRSNGVAVWPDWNFGVRVRGYDAAGPDLLDLKAPSGNVGASLAFSVTPRDNWSAITATTWDFGDGTGASGSSVSHAYGAAGSYTVTATSIDELGNQTTAQAAVVVSVVTPVPRDDDGDGAVTGIDCDDTNPAIRPGARDRPQNRIDENCDGKDAPYRRNRTRVDPGWIAFVTYTTVDQIELAELPPKAKVRVKCSGRGCTFKQRKVKVSKRQAKATKFFRGAKLAVGTVIELRITAPLTMGRVIRYRIRSHSVPSRRDLCLTPGRKRPHRC